MKNFRYDYRGIGRWMVGPECRALVEAKANEAARLYQGIVAKRTGELAASAHVSTRINDIGGRRCAGVLTVEAPYAASHEYGTQYEDAAHDLNVVLSMLGGR